jgi:hypothetical protein
LEISILVDFTIRIEKSFDIMSHWAFLAKRGSMFYLLLALLYEDLVAGRMDQAQYEENISLLALDHDRLKEEESKVDHKKSAA